MCIDQPLPAPRQTDARGHEGLQTATQEVTQPHTGRHLLLTQLPLNLLALGNGDDEPGIHVRRQPGEDRRAEGGGGGHCKVQAFAAPALYQKCVHLYTSTPLHMYTCTLVHLYTCTPVQCTPVHFSTCTPAVPAARRSPS